MENLEPKSYKLHEGHDDDFDDDEMLMDEDHPMWRSERITLNSVGIDIGSSTSHLIFSRLTLRRQGVALSSRFVVINREILHESPILLTPYIDKTTIDTNNSVNLFTKLIVRRNLTPEDIDTGAIIVTGEAAKKKNAEAIAALFSAEAGKFVCATAGHNLEAILAYLVDVIQRLGIDIKNSISVLGSEEVRTVREHFKKQKPLTKATEAKTIKRRLPEPGRRDRHSTPFQSRRNAGRSPTAGGRRSGSRSGSGSIFPMTSKWRWRSKRSKSRRRKPKKRRPSNWLPKKTSKRLP